MNSLLFGLILGLLIVVHSTPLTTVTQFPKSEDDILREAVTDGFLIDHNFHPSLTTEVPKRLTTPQSTTVPLSNVDVIEGSAVESGESAENFTFTHSAAQLLHEFRNEHDTTTTASVLSVQTSTSTADYHTTSSGQIMADRETAPTAAPVRPEGPDMFQVNEGSGAESGSGVSEEAIIATVHDIVKQKNSRILISDNGIIGQSVEKPPENTLPKGHVTPDWIIILAFIVGLAALVLLCIAIATRDKWNAPNQLNKTEITFHSVDQQRTVEMESFLHKERPRENRKAEEYRVIPLEDLPDSLSSQ